MRRIMFILPLFLLVNMNFADDEKTLKEEIIEKEPAVAQKTEEDAADELIQACVDGDYDTANKILHDFKGIIPKTLNLVKKPRLKFKDEHERTRVLKTLENFQKLKTTFQAHAYEDEEAQLGIMKWGWKYMWRVATISGFTFGATMIGAWALQRFGGIEVEDPYGLIADAVWKNAPEYIKNLGEGKE